MGISYAYMSEVIELALFKERICMGRSHVNGGQSPTTIPFHLRNQSLYDYMDSCCDQIFL